MKHKFDLSEVQLSILPILLLLLEISLLHIKHCILVVLIHVHCISIISICIVAIVTIFAFVTFLCSHSLVLGKLSVVQVEFSACQLVVLAEFNTLVPTRHWDTRSHLFYDGRSL